MPRLSMQHVSPDLAPLVDLLRGRRIVVLSGAGVSTESGIPDYRGPKTRKKARNPIQYRAFVDDPAARVRYWSRSAVGWPRLSAARPNEGHRALARMEAADLVCGVITQNVDRLHGALADVRCQGCGDHEARSVLQERLHRLNPGYRDRDHSAELAPDGDAELLADGTRSFRVPACRACGGVLKPDVVFFGENVPRPKVEAAWQLYDEADVLLVVGSSLAVYSGYRFVLRAAREERPVALVNLGPTRGDDAAAVRVEGRTGEVLPRLADALLSAGARDAAA